MRLRMPELAALRAVAMPAEPPIDHRRRDPGQVRTRRDVHRSACRQREPVFEHGGVPEEIFRRRLHRRQKRLGEGTAVQGLTNVRGQGRKLHIQEARIGFCREVRIAPGNMPTGDGFASHQTPPDILPESRPM